MDETTATDPLSFVCPRCKKLLKAAINAYECSKCDQAYPINRGIPDFLVSDSLASSSIITRIAKSMDSVAPIYESRFWPQLNLGLAGAKNSSLRGLANFHSKTLEDTTGAILDVACGPITYGRRIVSPYRSVYGIDISMGMLQEGKKYLEREGISNVYLARARAEELPFENAVFEGAICSGSLHLFPDTVSSLREIARTMKKGAPLSVQAFLAGNTSVNRALKKQTWTRDFNLDELRRYTADAGFEGFQFQLDGPIVITFSVRKA